MDDLAHTAFDGEGDAADPEQDSTGEGCHKNSELQSTESKMARGRMEIETGFWFVGRAKELSRERVRARHKAGFAKLNPYRELEPQHLNPTARSP